MSETKAIAIDVIRIDGGTQPRAAISEATVSEYAEQMDAKPFPPPDVFFDGVDYWLADGFHRYFAAKRLEKSHLTVAVHTGTKREAVLFSVGANAGHGLQRTNADKRKAVMTLINDDEWGKWSGHEIARRCGVSHTFANELKAEKAATEASLAPSASEPSIQPRTFITKHGTETTMRIGNIGRSSTDRSASAVQERRHRISQMARDGHSSQQIAAALSLNEQTTRKIARLAGIDIPADRAVGKTKRHDSNRIVQCMVMDAENLTADVNLIDFARLDRDGLGGWITSLLASRKALDAFIRQLIKEQKHGEAA